MTKQTTSGSIKISAFIVVINRCKTILVIWRNNVIVGLIEITQLRYDESNLKKGNI